MIGKTFGILFFTIFNIQTVNSRNIFKLKSYSGNTYHIKDSLVYFVTDNQDSAEKIWFSLNILEGNEWGEYDNDI
jgi:hypothetical protein